MKLTEEERAIVVNLQMEKVHRFLEQADEMCKQQYWTLPPIDTIMLVIMQFKPYSLRMSLLHTRTMVY